jgi:hypothetical protein
MEYHTSLKTQFSSEGRKGITVSTRKMGHLLAMDYEQDFQENGMISETELSIFFIPDMI